jgi:hypothetical protein
LEIGDQAVTLSPSYLSDALGDLLAAIIAVGRGAERATASFADEPGEQVWLFGATTQGRARIRVFGFADAWKRRTSEAGGRLLFDGECRLRALLPAVLGALDRLLEKWGTTGYLAEWVHFSFPTESHAELRALIEQRPWAPRDDSDRG